MSVHFDSGHFEASVWEAGRLGKYKAIGAVTVEDQQARVIAVFHRVMSEHAAEHPETRIELLEKALQEEVRSGHLHDSQVRHIVADARRSRLVGGASRSGIVANTKRIFEESVQTAVQAGKYKDIDLYDISYQQELVTRLFRYVLDRNPSLDDEGIVKKFQEVLTVAARQGELYSSQLSHIVHDAREALRKASLSTASQEASRAPSLSRRARHAPSPARSAAPVARAPSPARAPRASSPRRVSMTPATAASSLTSAGFAMQQIVSGTSFPKKTGYWDPMSRSSRELENLEEPGLESWLSEYNFADNGCDFPLLAVAMKYRHPSWETNRIVGLMNDFGRENHNPDVILFHDFETYCKARGIE